MFLTDADRALGPPGSLRSSQLAQSPGIATLGKFVFSAFGCTIKTRFCSLNLVLPGCTRVGLCALKWGLLWRGMQQQQPFVAHTARSQAGGTGKDSYKTKLSRKRASHHQPLPTLKQLLCNYEGNSILCSKSAPLWQTLRKKLRASHDRSL